MKREFLQNIQVGEQSLPKEVIDAIMAENGRDIQNARQAGEQWEEKYHRLEQEHSQKLQQMQLEHALQTSVAKARGRNAKAIAALLDMDAIGASEDLPGALDAAMEALKAEHGFLFDTDPVPPPYAQGTGTSAGAQANYPATLAGALREKYERK